MFRAVNFGCKQCKQKQQSMCKQRCRQMLISNCIVETKVNQTSELQLLNII